jgi:hypothetical protein
MKYCQAPLIDSGDTTLHILTKSTVEMANYFFRVKINVYYVQEISNIRYISQWYIYRVMYKSFCTITSFWEMS